jgi:hypothetical protein
MKSEVIGLPILVGSLFQLLFPDGAESSHTLQARLRETSARTLAGDGVCPAEKAEIRQCTEIKRKLREFPEVIIPRNPYLLIILEKNTTCKIMKLTTA